MRDIAMGFAGVWMILMVAGCTLGCLWMVVRRDTDPVIRVMLGGTLLAAACYGYVEYTA